MVEWWWGEVVPSEHLLCVLEGELFPRWLAVLHRRPGPGGGAGARRSSPQVTSYAESTSHTPGMIGCFAGESSGMWVLFNSGLPSHGAPKCSVKAN